MGGVALAAWVGEPAATVPDATGFTTTPVSATAATAAGGTTRKTWPTLMTFGFSREFQRTRSRQF